MTDRQHRPTEILSSFGEIAERYDAIFCDIWGVLHNGVEPFQSSGEALARYRAGGGKVVLMSNAPRPAASVAKTLREIGVQEDAYDLIVTSGDLARIYLEGHLSETVHHIGPPREAPLFAGLDVKLQDVETADYVICTGFADDETQTTKDYIPVLERMRARNLWMLCANPDLVVDRGDRLIECAGSIALAYEQMGGEVYYAGKPHPPIYGRAAELAGEARGTPVSKSRTLAIGDAIRTDVQGATAYGIDCLMLGCGIHAAELGQPGDGRAEAWLAGQPVVPAFMMYELEWR